MHTDAAPPGLERRRSNSAPPSSRPKDKPTYNVNCYECGKPTTVNFKPDGVRPIYCQECFQLIREKGMSGSAARADLVEAPAPAVPEISLTEALQKGPVSFKEDARRTGDPQPPRVMTERSIQKMPAEPVPNRDEIHSIKTLKPGQVVKF